MAKRVFVALGISEKLQEHILAWEQRFPSLPVRWLKGKNLHITLIPPWEENEVDKVKETLRKRTVGGDAIDLKFERVAFGPNPREPRLIWAEGNTMNQLLLLRKQLYQTLGFQPDPRPFKLHLTLARFRPEHFRTFPVTTLNETVDWRDTINSFVLMESRLHPNGAEYEIVTEIKL